ncbi:MAG: type II toxin-antitoxin system Phd/YefM family antitoxin [Lentisphaeria bacterium]|nr:type II toxin-antitoxin system Phd/YefM family antitoxin [Lentisphaeria bacterium]NQZ66883.1 type II toxin-antitoxin system Phd/YefM family antitoxin [Lentisphaeria bacterium]
MERIDLSSDIRPLSDFRAEASSCIKHIHNTKRPMLITQRGKGVAVLLDIHEYEAMQERIEFLQDIHTAEEQIKSGETTPHKQSKENVLSRLKNES